MGELVDKLRTVLDLIGEADSLRAGAEERDDEDLHRCQRSAQQDQIDDVKRLRSEADWADEKAEEALSEFVEAVRSA